MLRSSGMRCRSVFEPYGGLGGSVVVDITVLPLSHPPPARHTAGAARSDLIVGAHHLYGDEGALPPYPAMADCGRMKSTELIRALVEPELQAQLRRAAQEQDRSLSWSVHEILAAWAQQQRQQGQEQAA